jgi:Arc/MetJ-type ribon-helix-helix transcriptional regulator
LKTYNCRIALRLSDREREKIEQLIRERKFKNLSQAARTALNELLKKHEGTKQ